MAASTDASRTPVPVRTIARHLVAYVDKLGAIWIEGQVAQVNRRPGAGRIFFTLRDTAVEMSISMSTTPVVADAAGLALREGNRIVAHAKAEYYSGRGSLTFAVREIKAVGIGALLATLEALRTTLAAEGLFDPRRKRRLPFLPNTIGLICGRASDAERDVVENARRRWPAVAFDIHEVAVQGPRAVSEIIDALAALNAMPHVDVIVIARGGGSVEDLLPFSNEELLRAVSASRHPVVSAIGHEKDSPLLDLVADVRASTPTDAARHVVPEISEQVRMIGDLVGRGRRVLDRSVTSETERIRRVLSRPVLADRHAVVDVRYRALDEGLARLRRSWDGRLDGAGADLVHTRARIRALSPAATLERGYAVVQRDDGAVVRSPEQVTVGAVVRLRLAGGEVHARVE